MILIDKQVPLQRIETVMGMSLFEQWLWGFIWIEVSRYHGENGIFTADEHHKDCYYKVKNKSFNGVGAQHQNAQAECEIKTIIYMLQNSWCTHYCIGQRK